MTARDPIAAARGLLEKAEIAPGLELAAVPLGDYRVSIRGESPNGGFLLCRVQFDTPASEAGLGLCDLFAAAPALLGELAAEVERLRGVQNRLAERFPLPFGGMFTFDAVTKEWWYGLGAFRKGPFPSKAAAVLAFAENSVPIDNPWPDHPVIEPDPAEAVMAEERARIEALARQDSEQSRLRSERDLDELREEGTDPDSLGDEA